MTSLRGVLGRTTGDLNRKRKETLRLQQEVQAKESKLEQLKQEAVELEAKIAATHKSMRSAEEISAELEATLQLEEREEERQKQQLNQLRDRLTKEQQTLHELRQKETLLLNQAEGTAVAGRNLGSRCRKLDEESLQQQQVLYKQEFDITRKERRLQLLEGKRPENEQKELGEEEEGGGGRFVRADVFFLLADHCIVCHVCPLEDNQIAKLKTDLEEHQRTHSLVNGQLRKVQDEIRLTRRQLDKVSANKAVVTEKLESLNLYLDRFELRARVYFLCACAHAPHAHCIDNRFF